MSASTVDPPELAVALHAAPLDPRLDAAGGTDVVWATRQGETVVLKRATGRARSELRREAETLDRLRMPGLVELVELVDDDDVTAMVLHDAGAHTLQALDDRSTERALSVLVRTAEALDALHGAGWTHGRLSAEHVVIAPRGRVRLCSLSAARPDAARPDSRRADLDALLMLVEQTAAGFRPSRGDGRRHRRVQRVIEQMRRSDVPPEAAEVAARLRRVVDTSSRPAARVSRVRLPSARQTGSAAAGLCMLAAVVGVASSLGDHPPGSDTTMSAVARPSTSTTLPPTPVTTVPPTTVPPTTGAAAADDHAPELIVDGVRYRIGLPGDVALVGDWDADGRDDVRVLRPATGELFGFPDPAGLDTVEGELLGTFPGAVTLRAPRPDEPARDEAAAGPVIGFRDGTERIAP